MKMDEKEQSILEKLATCKRTSEKNLKKIIVICTVLLTIFSISNPAFANTSNNYDQGSKVKADIYQEPATPTSASALEESPTSEPVEPTATATDAPATETPEQPTPTITDTPELPTITPTIPVKVPTSTITNTAETPTITPTIPVEVPTSTITNTAEPPTVTITPTFVATSPTKTITPTPTDDLKSQGSTTYYVSTTGSDSNPGTQSQPWKTIQKAADTMAADDTVTVLAGNYPARISVSGSHLIFVAQGTVVTQAWDVSGSYNTVNGFEIIDPNSSWGVRVGTSISTTATGNLIENNNIHNTMQDGIWFFGYNNTYRGNYIHDIHTGDDTHIDCFQTWGPASGAIFERNTCINPNTSAVNQMIMVESQYTPVNNLIFRNNIFVMYCPSGPCAMNFNGADIPYAISNISVINNTVVNLGNYIGNESAEFVDISGGEFRNNLIINYGLLNQHDYVGIYSCTGMVVSNNAVWTTDGVPPSGAPYPGDLWMQDPKLVNLAGLDFHLQPISPLIDKGVNLGSENTDDINGDHRPVGSGYDIGAYELQSQQATATVSSPTKTNTPAAPTATRTRTPVPPTATRTNTPVTPTSTKTRTPVPPTATRTNTPVTPTSTKTRTPVTSTATPTKTPMAPTATRTNTPKTPTATPTKTAMPPTATPTPTSTPLSSPILAAPTNNGTALTTRPDFSWNSVSGATGYTFQLSTSSAFSSLTTNLKVTTPNYTVTSDLARAKTYYWRVMANGSKSSAWSQVFSFTSANPPAIPSLAKPTNGTLLTDYQPRLDWHGSASTFQVQVASSSTFSVSSIVMDVNTTYGTHYDLRTPLPANGTYYWHVRGFDATGEYSLWSSYLSFKTAMVPPTLLDPHNNTSALTTRPTFDWNTVSGATGYKIQISKYSTFSSKIVDTAVTNPLYTPTADLPRNTLIYWRASATGSRPSTWSQVFSFTSADPPLVPALVNPTNNSLVTSPPTDNTVANSSASIQSWKKVTGADHYQLQVATDRTFPTASMVNDVTTTDVSYPISTSLAPNTTFFWRVRSFAVNGQYSLWSPYRTFRTAMLPPVLLTPALNASITALRPTFDWNDVTGASGYVIQISTHEDFSTNLINSSITKSTYISKINLPRGVTIYWRVYAKGTNPSSWAKSSFKIQ